METKMTDREMLMLAFGALKINPITNAEVIELVQEHLFTPTVVSENKPVSSSEVEKNN